MDHCFIQSRGAGWFQGRRSRRILALRPGPRKAQTRCLRSLSTRTGEDNSLGSRFVSGVIVAHSLVLSRTALCNHFD
jgi:hypothetical protein